MAGAVGGPEVQQAAVRAVFATQKAKVAWKLIVQLGADPNDYPEVRMSCLNGELKWIVGSISAVRPVQLDTAAVCGPSLCLSYLVNARGASCDCVAGRCAALTQPSDVANNHAVIASQLDCFISRNPDCKAMVLKELARCVFAIMTSCTPLFVGLCRDFSCPLCTGDWGGFSTRW